MTDPAKTNAAAEGPGADEFAHIPRSRTRHPLFAILGAALAFYLVFHIRHDLRYALSSGEVLDLGNARTVFGAAQNPEGLTNRYVRVAGTPDRESGLELDTKGSWIFTQFFRVLGTHDRLFLHRMENPLPAGMAERDVFEGRLIRFDRLTFADATRAYFARHVTATHFFAPDLFARAVAERAAGRPLTIVDRAGDHVTLTGPEALAIDVVKPEHVRIGLPRARFATEADARAAIESRGGEVASSQGLVKGALPSSAPAAGPLAAGPAPPERWTFVARFPAARRQAALAALGDVDRTVEIRDARETLTTRAADVSAAGGALVVRVQEAGGADAKPNAQPGPQERRIAPGEIAAVHMPAPVEIPPDAYLLVEGDHPREHLSTLLIALVLVSFGVINVMGLIRQRMRR